jgi:hypothetical protein
VVARSTFLESFSVFGDLFHQGRIIELDSLQEGAVLIRVLAVWRGKTWHLDFILQGGISLVPIYLLVKFGIIWRSPSAGPKPWPSHPSSRTCQQLGGLDVTLALIVFGSSSHIQPLEAYFVLSGAFCSSSYLLSWSHLMLFQICFHIVSGSCFS